MEVFLFKPISHRSQKACILLCVSFSSKLYTFVLTGPLRVYISTQSTAADKIL